MKKYLGIAMCTALLQGCGDEANVWYPDITPNELSYSYPYHGQTQVSPSSPFVARFSDPVKAIDTSSMTPVEIDQALADLRAEVLATVVWARTSDDAAVGYSVRLVDNDPDDDVLSIDTLMLVPSMPLDLVTTYEVDLTSLQTDKGTANVEVGPISFTTRGEAAGPRTTAITSASFELEKIVPDGNAFPVADFSSLRLQFSHPLDENTVTYGTSISLLDESAALVPAAVLVSGPKLTIDPQQDLDPAQGYQLVIADNALYDRFGNPLAGESRDLQPAKTAPRSLLAQRIDASNSDSMLYCDSAQADVVLSPLSSDPINCVPIESTILGETTSSQTSGDLFAELAFVPNFPDTTPLRIQRGALLNGASVEVLVAGQVPAWVDTNDDGVADTPLETGDIAVTFISDANGYLFANPHTDKEDEPRHLRLLLDVALTAKTPEANGGLSQNMLHIEVVGTAIVKDGRLIIDALGVVEPRVLGLDDAFGLLSFHMETYENNADAPPRVVDTTMPSLQSWTPGDDAESYRPGSPLNLNFSEPLDPASVALAGAIGLQKDGVDIPFSWRLDGGTVVIQPESPLEFSSLAADVVYTVTATSLLKDMAGNPLDQDYGEDFSLPVYEGMGSRAAFVTASYPGFPCAKTGTLNLASDQQGRCLGGKNTDDVLPVVEQPAERSIRLDFSQNMDADTFVLGAVCGAGTFRVEVVDDSGVCQSVVPGVMTTTARRLEFMPDEPWQAGTLYRYVLVSQASSSPSCGSNAACTDFGYPVQTAVLQGNPADEGGPDMTNYFRGGARSDTVYQALANLPTSDVNADYLHADTELQPLEDPMNAGLYLTPTNSGKLDLTDTGGLLQGANVGCGFVGRDAGDIWALFIANPPPLACEDKKYVYVNGSLSADLIGWDDTENAVAVHVYPTAVMTTSADTFAILNMILWKQLDLIPTGPTIMRIRYSEDAFGVRNQPVTGYIRETADGPVFNIDLEMYLDAPELKPTALGIPLKHSLHSHAFDLHLAGPVILLPDGRMKIGLISTEDTADIKVDISLIGIGAASMTLKLPKDGVNLSYLAPPLKE